MAGRPQTYLGYIEDAHVEAQALGHELCAADEGEWAELVALRADLAALVPLLAAGSRTRAIAERARARVIRLLERDVAENRRHRALVRRPAGEIQPGTPWPRSVAS